MAKEPPLRWCLRSSCHVHVGVGRQPVGYPASVLDQLMSNQIFGGIFSSICFAVISSIYFLGVRHMRNRGLRALIPSWDSDVAVVCPGQASQAGDGKAGSMTTQEAMALAEVLQCAAALNKNPTVLSSADKPRHPGIISLGGGVYNSFTAANLSDFCPRLKVNPCGPGQDTRISHGSTQIDTPSPVKSIAFIIFLSSFITGCRGPVLLIFGEYGIDTCAAAHYLRTNADKLYRQFRGRAFAVKLVTRPRLECQGFPDGHVDISKDVFGKVEPSRRKRLLEWIHARGRSRHPGQSPLPYLRPRPPGESRNRAAATAGWRGRRTARAEPDG